MPIPVMQDQTASMMKGMNEAWYNPNFDPNMFRRPDRFIYLYTVSKREFLIERPPLHPHLRVPPCGPQERFKLVASVPDPFTQIVDAEGMGKQSPVGHNGVRVAIDLINPNNISMSLDWEAPSAHAAEFSTGHGCDLSRQGLFLSFSNPPAEEEIKKAEARRHKYYDGLRATAVMMEVTNAKEMAEQVQNNNDYHLMADYFNLEFFWHKTVDVKVSCPNCGEKIKEGAAFHMLGTTKCVNDWKRAFEAGVVKKEEIPESKQWWAEERAKPRSSGRDA